MTNGDSPGRAIRNVINGWVVLCVALVLGVVTLFVLYQGGWWMFADSTNRNAQVQQHSYGAQAGLAQDLDNQIAQIDSVNVSRGAADPAQRSALTAQLHALLNQACSLANRLDFPSAPAATWLSQNCTAGHASPSSEYNQ